MDAAKWMRKDSDICYWYECSNCGGETPRNRWGTDWFSAYCPSCGKPMNETIEEDFEY